MVLGCCGGLIRAGEVDILRRPGCLSPLRGAALDADFPAIDVACVRLVLLLGVGWLFAAA